MTCQELVELLTEYLEGSLAADDHERFEDHLMTCRYCETYLDQMQTTIELLGSLSEEHLPPAARDQLLAAFRNWKLRGA